MDPAILHRMLVAAMSRSGKNGTLEALYDACEEIASGLGEFTGADRLRKALRELVDATGGDLAAARAKAIRALRRK